MKAVVVQGLTYRYQKDAPLVLRGIEFQVPKGETVVSTGLGKKSPGLVKV